MTDNLKQKVVKGIIWQLVEKFGNYFLSFGISVILARLLEPSEFGLIGLTVIFPTVATSVIDSGMGWAIIQKKDADELDYNSVFYLTMLVAVLMSLLLFLGAPWIALFYDKPKFVDIMRWMSLLPLLSAVGCIQRTYLCKNMMFYLNCRITWGANLPSGILGIWMALCGYGVYALIAQQICRNVLSCLLLWFLVKWRPRAVFDFSRIRSLFGFGWKMMVANFVGQLFSNLNGLVIGKYQNIETLAYYQKGQNLPTLGVGVINDSISGVMLPAFSSIQDDRERIARMFQKSLKNIMFLLAPFLVILVILSHPIIYILYTTKWLPCVIFMQIFSSQYIFMPLHSINLQLVLASGHSGYYLCIEIVKKIAFLISLLLTVQYGAVAMAWGSLCLSFLSVFINGYFTGRLIGYSCFKQLYDVIPNILLSVVLGVIVYIATLLFDNAYCRIGIGLTLYTGVYVIFSFLLRKVPSELADYLLILKNKVLRSFSN